MWDTMHVQAFLYKDMHGGYNSTIPTSVAMDSALSLNAASCSNCSESLPYWSKASWDATEGGGVGGEKNQCLCIQWGECICLFMCIRWLLSLPKLAYLNTEVPIVILYSINNVCMMCKRVISQLKLPISYAQSTHTHSTNMYTLHCKLLQPTDSWLY